MSTVTFENGNKEVTMTITGSKVWEKEGSKRVYFDLSFTNKRSPVSKLYEVLEGSSRDHQITIDGRTFAYEYGIDANSNTKREAIDEAVAQIVKSV